MDELTRFHDVRFPLDIAFGATGGPERRTEVVSTMSGYEERNTRWQHSRRRYNAGYGVKSLADLEKVIHFFEDRRGKLHGFRWRDIFDYKSSLRTEDITFHDQTIGFADGMADQYQLVKSYGEENPYNRPIQKPVNQTARVGVDGIEVTEGQDYEMIYNLGLIKFFEPPMQGAKITAGFEFDVPVRFDMDQLEFNLQNFEAGDIPQIPLLEIRL